MCVLFVITEAHLLYMDFYYPSRSLREPWITLSYYESFVSPLLELDFPITGKLRAYSIYYCHVSSVKKIAGDECRKLSYAKCWRRGKPVCQRFLMFVHRIAMTGW